MTSTHQTGIVLVFACATLLLQAESQAGKLPDTGQNLCYDGTDMVTCTQGNSGDAGTYPGQDGRFGRDAAADEGQLTKIGSGEAGFDYTRLCNSGEEEGQNNCPSGLTATNIGSGANQWGCTRDNITGLIWEVKHNDNTSLQHKDWTYTWYNADSNSNGGDAGVEDTGNGVGSDNCLDDARCDTEKYVADVNALNICGETTDDWHLPRFNELESIAHLGRGSTTAPAPLIDQTVFPNTISDSYSTAAPFASFPAVVWAVNFAPYISGYAKNKSDLFHVRLVRGGQ